MIVWNLFDAIVDALPVNRENLRKWFRDPHSDLYSMLSYIFLFHKFFFFVGGSQGLAAVPGREDEFKQCLELSIKYAEAVKCTR